MKTSELKFLAFWRQPGAGPWAVLMVFFPILLGLGFWQLSRAEEKRVLELQDRMRALQPPVPLESAGPKPLPDGAPVQLTGFYDDQRLWYLDNRIFHRRVGYEVISPFLLSSGLTVLVNRGWWQGSADRRILPKVEPVPGLITLTGRIHHPSGKPLLLRPDEPGPGWPKRVQAVAMERMAAALESELYPRLVRLSPDQPGTRPADWRVVTMTPARHTAYAVTWFALAGVLCLLCWFAGHNRFRRVRSSFNA